MTVSLKYPVVAPALPEPAPPLFVGPGSTADQKTLDELFLGCGVVRPFQRDGRGDFHHECDEANVRAAVGQILLTICSSDYTIGEIPWRPEFGSMLYLLRHMNNDLDLMELGRVYVIEALRRWEPRVNVKSARVSRSNTEGVVGLNVLEIAVRYDIVDRRRLSVLASNINQVQTVTLAA